MRKNVEETPTEKGLYVHLTFIEHSGLDQWLIGTYK